MWINIKNEARLIYKNLLPYLCVTAVISYLVYGAGRSFLIKGTYLTTEIVSKGILSADLEWVRRSVLDCSILSVLFSIFIIYGYLNSHENVKELSYIIPLNSMYLILARICNLVFSLWLFGMFGSIIGNIVLKVKYPMLQIKFIHIFGYSLVEGIIRLLPHIALYVLIYYFVSSLVEGKKFILYYTFSIFMWFILAVFINYIVKIYVPLTVFDALTNPINILKIIGFLISSIILAISSAKIYDNLRIGKKVGLKFNYHTDRSRGRARSMARYEYKIAYNFRIFSIFLVPSAVIFFVAVVALSKAGNLESFYPVILAVSEFIFPITIIPLVRSITAVERDVNIESMVKIIPKARSKQFSYRSIIFIAVCLFTVVFYTVLVIILFKLDSFQTQRVILATVPNLLLMVSLNLLLITFIKNENIGILISISVWFILYSVRKVLPYMVNPFVILTYSPFSSKILQEKYLY